MMGEEGGRLTGCVHASHQADIAGSGHGTSTGLASWDGGDHWL